MYKKLKAFAVLCLLSLLSLVWVSPAFATVPTGTDTMFTAIGTDAATIQGYAITVVMAVLGMLIVIKLIKRFGNKV